MDKIILGLKELAGSGNLNLIEGLKSDDIMNDNRQKYLDMHPYKIYFSEKENRWRSILPDSNKKRGVKDIKRIKKEDIENLIVDYYKNNTNPSLRFSRVYIDWLMNYKILEVSPSSLQRIHTAYKRHIENSELDKMSVDKVTPLELKTFLLKVIKDNNMNYKAYNNVATIPRQVFEYCVEKEWIDSNPMDRVKIKKNVYRHDKKPEAKTQVYMESEKELLEKHILDIYDRNPATPTMGLGILLAFQTAMRVGEVVGLKNSDIKGDYLTVERTEISYNFINPDGSLGEAVHTIKEFPKSADGNRDIPLTVKAKDIIRRINLSNELNGVSDKEYLFVNKDGTRMYRQKIDTAIRKYCREVNMNPRSSHKIRKTVISALMDSGAKGQDISKDEIRRIAGHADLAVTNSCYVFDRNPQERTLKTLNNIL